MAFYTMRKIFDFQEYNLVAFVLTRGSQIFTFYQKEKEYILRKFGKKRFFFHGIAYLENFFYH